MIARLETAASASIFHMDSSDSYLRFRMVVAKVDGPDSRAGANVQDSAYLVLRVIRWRRPQTIVEHANEEIVLKV